jgi:long-chain acyl-CoA synthetase
MLSHRNILWNVEAVLRLVPAYLDDVFLSFLPLSHAFERTCGYYLPMSAGSCVAYARSVQELPEDLLAVRPTVLISVPRIYERLYARLQQQLAEKGGVARRLFDQAAQIGWRRFLAAQGRAPAPPWSDRVLWPVLQHAVADRLLARLGGRLRVTVSGGAPLVPRIAECLIGLGLPLLQGYGLTEAAPVVSANLLEDNLPESVGVPLPGVEVKIGARDELLVRSPGVMLGYWNRPEDTREAIDAEGWLHTGDQARISAGHIYVVGRLKEIIVMSTGEKVAPNDLEMATCMDPLFDQAMAVGEGMPYVGLLLVVNGEAWRKLAPELGVAPDDPAALRAEAVTRLALARAQAAAHAFPRYAQPRAVWLTLEPWTIENGLITPTMKLKRSVLAQRFASGIRMLYAGNDLGRPGALVA